MFEIVDLGLVDYREAQDIQLRWVEKVQKDSTLQVLIFCSHPPIATCGRKTQKTDLFAWQGDRIDVQRGGRVTYHGPHQLVCYPILSLEKERERLPLRDVNAYLRALENVVIETLKEFGVAARPEPEGLTINEDQEATGVWVGNQKIASVGIGVKKWVTFHGTAINLHHDPKAFQGMNPCGFSSDVMTSLEALTGQRINSQVFSKKLQLKIVEQIS